jgi:hypothetical protein
MVTFPAESGGVMKLHSEFEHVGEALWPSMVTEAPARFDPLIVTVVPPAVGPELGVTEVTVGAGT